MPIVEKISIEGLDEAIEKIKALGDAGAAAFGAIGSAADAAASETSALGDAIQKVSEDAPIVASAVESATADKPSAAPLPDDQGVAAIDRGEAVNLGQGDLGAAPDRGIASDSLASPASDSAESPLPVQITNWPPQDEAKTPEPGAAKSEAEADTANPAVEAPLTPLAPAVPNAAEAAAAAQPIVAAAAAETAVAQASPVIREDVTQAVTEAAPAIAAAAPPSALAVAAHGLFPPNHFANEPTGEEDYPPKPTPTVAPNVHGLLGPDYFASDAQPAADHAASAPPQRPTPAEALASHGSSEEEFENSAKAAERARDRMREAAKAGAEAFNGTREAVVGLTEALSGLSAAGAITAFEGIGHTVSSLVSDLGTLGTITGTVVGGLTAIGAALGGVALAGGELAHSTAEDVLGMEDISRTAGATVQQVQGLKDSFSEAGVSADNIGFALKNLAVRSEAEWPSVAKASRDAADSSARDALKIRTSSRDVETAKEGERSAVIKTAEASNAALDAKEKEETSRFDVADARLAVLKAQQAANIAHTGSADTSLDAEIKDQEEAAADRAVRRAQIDLQAKQRTAQEAPLETEKAEIAKRAAERDQASAPEKLSSAILELSSSIKAQQDNLLTNFDAVAGALKGDKNGVDINRVSPQTFFDLALRNAGPEATAIDRLASIADIFTRLSGQQQTAFGRESIGRGYTPEVGNVLARGGDYIRENAGRENEFGKAIENAVAAARKEAIAEEGARDAAQQTKIAAGTQALPGATEGLEKIKSTLEASTGAAKDVGAALGSAMSSMAGNADKAAAAVKDLAIAIGALYAASIISGAGKALTGAAGALVGGSAAEGVAGAVAGGGAAAAERGIVARTVGAIGAAGAGVAESSLASPAVGVLAAGTVGYAAARGLQIGGSEDTGPANRVLIDRQNREREIERELARARQRASEERDVGIPDGGAQARASDLEQKLVEARRATEQARAHVETISRTPENEPSIHARPSDNERLPFAPLPIAPEEAKPEKKEPAHEPARTLAPGERVNPHFGEQPTEPSSETYAPRPGSKGVSVQEKKTEGVEPAEGKKEHEALAVPPSFADSALAFVEAALKAVNPISSAAADELPRETKAGNVATPSATSPSAGVAGAAISTPSVAAPLSASNEQPGRAVTLPRPEGTPQPPAPNAPAPVIAPPGLIPPPPPKEQPPPQKAAEESAADKIEQSAGKSSAAADRQSQSADKTESAASSEQSAAERQSSAADALSRAGGEVAVASQTLAAVLADERKSRESGGATAGSTPSGSSAEPTTTAPPPAVPEAEPVLSPEAGSLWNPPSTSPATVSAPSTAAVSTPAPAIIAPHSEPIPSLPDAGPKYPEEAIGGGGVFPDASTPYPSGRSPTLSVTPRSISDAAVAAARGSPEGLSPRAISDAAVAEADAVSAAPRPLERPTTVDVGPGGVPVEHFTTPGSPRAPNTRDQVPLDRLLGGERSLIIPETDLIPHGKDGRPTVATNAPDIQNRRDLLAAYAPGVAEAQRNAIAGTPGLRADVDPATGRLGYGSADAEARRQAAPDTATLAAVRQREEEERQRRERELQAARDYAAGYASGGYVGTDDDGNRHRSRGISHTDEALKRTQSQVGGISDEVSSGLSAQMPALGPGSKSISHTDDALRRTQSQVGGIAGEVSAGLSAQTPSFGMAKGISHTDEALKRTNSQVSGVSDEVLAGLNAQTPYFAGGGIFRSVDDRSESGGYVRGDGGPKGDRIHAMLSDREYVIQADAVDKYGVDAMHAINEGRAPHFADGGEINLGDTFNTSSTTSVLGAAEINGGMMSARAFADGGSVTSSMPSRDGEGGLHPVHLTIDGQKFDPMLAPPAVAEAMSRFTMDRKLAQSGPAQSWVVS